jgi:hypothetical protein
MEEGCSVGQVAEEAAVVAVAVMVREQQGKSTKAVKAVKVVPFGSCCVQDVGAAAFLPWTVELQQSPACFAGDTAEQENQQTR